MTQADYLIFSRGLDAILAQPVPPARFYAESDGGYCGSLADMPRTFYVCYTRNFERIDCESMREAKELAASLNEVAKTV